MKRKSRTHYSAAERTIMWDLYQRGDSLTTIASLFSKSHTSAAGVIGRTGGIRPVERKRRDSSLTFEEREEISRGNAVGNSIRSIAQDLGRAPSTVSREIFRNGGPKKYRASKAETHAWKNAKRPKSCKLLLNRMLNLTVARKLKKGWSPQQIDGWLKCTYPKDKVALCLTKPSIKHFIYKPAVH